MPIWAPRLFPFRGPLKLWGSNFGFRPKSTQQVVYSPRKKTTLLLGRHGYYHAHLARVDAGIGSHAFRATRLRVVSLSGTLKIAALPSQKKRHACICGWDPSFPAKGRIPPTSWRQRGRGSGELGHAHQYPVLHVCIGFSR